MDNGSKVKFEKFESEIDNSLSVGNQTNSSEEDFEYYLDADSNSEEEKMSTGTNTNIEKLTKVNYDTWKLQMEAILIKNDAWEYAKGTIVRPAVAADIPAWEKKDGKARADIILAMSSSELCHIKHCNTSHEVWRKLEEVYLSKGPARKATLLKQLLFTKLSEDGNMSDHLNEFFNCVDKLKQMDISVADDLLSIVLLYSIPSKYENFRCAIEARDNLPTPEALKVKLLEEAAARQSQADVQGRQEALQVHNFNRYNKGDKYSKRNHAGWLQNKSKSNQYNNNNSNVGEKYNLNKALECFYCQKRGHKASQCLKRKIDTQKAQMVRQTQGSSSDGEALFAYIADENNKVTHETNLDITVSANENLARKWCLDSGATSHMCRNQSDFEFLTPIEGQTVKMANNETAAIRGKGTAILHTYFENKIKKLRFENTLFIPELKTNLVSIPKVTSKGKRVIFNEEAATIYGKDDRPIIVAKRERDLYFLDPIKESGAMVNENKVSIEDWHCRYGHLNEADLRMLAKNGLVHGLENMKTGKMETCEICLEGKQAATPMPKKKEMRNSEILELIHSDVCGPMRHKSIGGAKYFVTFIDDRSRWVKVYFIKSKDEAKDAFLNFRAAVENQMERRIKILRTDNGLEYMGKEFTKELEKHGIQRQFTTPHTPQQNGVAERMNRTLVEMARCMLIQSKLPAHFWAEAVNTASYVRNRCPTVHNRTPYEVWYHNKPNVHNLQIFGSYAYVLKKQHGKDKFESRSTKCIFLGYSDESKGYRLWNPERKCIVTSKDVSFLRKVERHTEKTDNTLSENFKYNLINDEEDATQNENDVNLEEPNEDVVEFRENEHILEEIDNEQINMDDQTDQQKQTFQRGRGRPTLIRTGKRGRPKRSYTTVQQDQNYAQMIDEHPNESLNEALSGPYGNEWRAAMKTEYEALIKNQVWELVKCPKNRTPIGSKWVLKTKYNSDGTIERRKARLVARGFAQRPGIEFNETYAPVARLTSIRLVTALAAKLKLDLYQLDITMAYTYGDLDEEIYMEQAENFVIRGKEDYVYRLKKSIYGLKQSGRQWFQKLDKNLKKLGLKQADADPCVYFIRNGDKIFLMTVYVDDIIIATNENEMLHKVKKDLREHFQMRDLGKLKYCLGMQFSQEKESKAVTVCQEKYIQDMVKRFGLEEANTAHTPLEPKANFSKNDDSPEVNPTIYQSLIGSLMYAAISTRPDVMYAVSALSCFNHCPKKIHWLSAKRVLRYLKCTSNLNLCFREDNLPLQGYVDSDWGGDIDSRISRTGFVFKLAGAAISWESRKQKSVAISSTEAEYMALTEATREAVYLRRFLHELKVAEPTEATTIYCDNQGAAKLVENPVFHARTKHIDIRHHYVRQIFQEGSIELRYKSTNDMSADLLTKSLSRPSHEKHCIEIGLKNINISR